MKLKHTHKKISSHARLSLRLNAVFFSVVVIASLALATVSGGDTTYAVVCQQNKKTLNMYQGSNTDVNRDVYGYDESTGKCFKVSDWEVKDRPSNGDCSNLGSGYIRRNDNKCVRANLGSNDGKEYVDGITPVYNDGSAIPPSQGKTCEGQGMTYFGGSKGGTASTSDTVNGSPHGNGPGCYRSTKSGGYCEFPGTNLSASSGGTCPSEDKASSTDGVIDKNRVKQADDKTQSTCVSKDGKTTYTTGNGVACKPGDTYMSKEDIQKEKEKKDAALKECDKKYPNQNSDENWACKEGVNGADCNALGGVVTDAKKKACEEGKALNPPTKTDPGKDGTGTGGLVKTGGEAGNCGKARTNLIACGTDGGITALGNVLKIALFVLTVIVGIAATGGIAYASILYAGAQDNAGNTQKAKEYIRNIVIGLIAYGLMIAIIGWLVPGSVIGK